MENVGLISMVVGIYIPPPRNYRCSEGVSDENMRNVGMISMVYWNIYSTTAQLSV